MAKIQKYIEIVRSDISGLSSLSRVSANAVQAVLAKHYSYVSISHINSYAELAALKNSSPDLVFLGMKFLPKNAHLGKNDPDKIWISDYLDEHAIPYTGSTSNAAQFDLDKSLAKRHIQRSGLSTADYFITNPDTLPSASKMPFDYPIFIKPPRMGGGQGVDMHSVAHTYAEFCTKVSSNTEQLGTDSLVEEYLTGREFSVALLMSEETGDLQVMPIELIAPMNERGDRMLSCVVKSADAEIAMAVTDARLRSDLCQLALDAFTALGGRDYGRIDIRLNKHGEPQFLEANLIPSIIEGYGSFPKACKLNLNLNHENMVLQIARLGLAHQPYIVDNDIELAIAPLVAPAFSLN